MKDALSLANELKKFRFRIPLSTRWSDMDEMHHVNNAVYLTYLEQSRVYYFDQVCQWDWSKEGVILANAHIEYIRPLRFPEEAFVYVRTSRMGSKSFDLNYVITRISNGTEECIATAYTTLVGFDYHSQTSKEVNTKTKESIQGYEIMLSQ